MSKIYLDRVCLNYPLVGESARSLKRDVLALFSGKRLQRRNIKTISAINNLSIKIERGDTIGLIGHNGAGKSTLLKVIAGIYDITSGNIFVEGSISAVLGGSIGMQPELNGYENIRLSSMIKGYDKVQTQEIISDVEDFSELGDFLYRPVKIYSAGMQARLAFAISTAINPDILLLDEVVGTGDSSFIKKASKRMENLVQKANILVLASHSPEIMKKFCKKVLWLDKGHYVAFGDTESVLRAYSEKYETSC